MRKKRESKKSKEEGENKKREKERRKSAREKERKEKEKQTKRIERKIMEGKCVYVCVRERERERENVMYLLSINMGRSDVEKKKPFFPFQNWTGYESSL